MSRPRLTIADIVVSALIPYLALWLYEASNWVTLAAQGYSVSFTMAGLLPLGVVGVSTGGPLPATKVIQLVLAIGPLACSAMLLSRANLRIAEAFAVSFIAVYFASAYWEMLSLLVVLPMAVHVGVFVVGTGCLSVLLLRAFMADRPKQASKMRIDVASPRR